MASEKPTFLFVPGAWHGPEIYSATCAILEKHGYECVSIPLPSAGASPPHTSFDGDVAGIRDETLKLVNQGKQVILTSHSYSGMPACEALKGLSRKARQEQGLAGGVIRLVFIMSFAMPEGFCPTAGGAQFPDWMKVDHAKQVVNVMPGDAKAIFYNDMPTTEADKWATKIVPQSLGVYDSTTTFAAWREIPSTFIQGGKDQTSFTPEVVDFMINNARKEKPDAFDQVEVCESGGHCLMIKYPDWLASAMLRAVGAGK